MTQRSRKERHEQIKKTCLLFTIQQKVRIKDKNNNYHQRMHLKLPPRTMIQASHLRRTKDLTSAKISGMSRTSPAAITMRVTRSTALSTGVSYIECFALPLEEIISVSEVWPSNEPMHWTTPPDPLLAIHYIQTQTHVNIVMVNVGRTIALRHAHWSERPRIPDTYQLASSLSNVPSYYHSAGRQNAVSQRACLQQTRGRMQDHLMFGLCSNIYRVQQSKSSQHFSCIKNNKRYSNLNHVFPSL